MKNTVLISFGIAILLFVGFCALFITKKEPAQIACTMEAKLCPDGSYVGRQGPQCEFAACPTLTESSKAKLNQKILNNGVYITPLEIVEDSRCPVDVTCIWAGQVRLKTKLQIGSDEQEVTLTLGTGITLAGKSTTLIEARPAKNSKIQVPAADYSFTFLVK
jgi:hypothetical protein